MKKIYWGKTLCSYEYLNVQSVRMMLHWKILLFIVHHCTTGKFPVQIKIKKINKSKIWKRTKRTWVSEVVCVRIAFLSIVLWLRWLMDFFNCSVLPRCVVLVIYWTLLPCYLALLLRHNLMVFCLALLILCCVMLPLNWWMPRVTFLLLYCCVALNPRSVS